MPDNSRALAWLDKREAAIAKQKEGKTVGTKGKVSLKRAMALAENKGKSEQEVIKDVESHGYQVVKP